MKINSRFEVALHILTLVAVNRDRPSVCTSEFLAKSVNTNPVVVRRIIASLKKAGLVKTQPGVKGTGLLKEPENISLLDVLRAVNDNSLESLFEIHRNINKKCLVATSVIDVIEKPLDEAQSALEESLGKFTLANILTAIKQETSLSRQYYKDKQKKEDKSAMIRLYTTPSCASCRKAKKWLEEHNISYVEKNMFSILLRDDELKELLARSENGTDDIISKRSKVIKEGNYDIDSMTMNELIKFIQDNPSVLKRPIIVDDRRFQVGYNDEEIRAFIPVELRRLATCDHDCPRPLKIKKASQDLKIAK